ncbi:3-dehydroquinate synthase [Chromobacterium sphagni]|uniref:3-dehydroquinate synthase n=1 Tax=Chromobacterium sphagni TaxID=1903179 RepID=A0A1S1X555_9NEIS|nr:3-dehydroquinate synthase [Chromobacterium sphagni]OHX14597.1 3-dehydroquinate synthase [Chromobacterium sphagni]OHX20733.1 3-dehydroquinate synthase [Chromobacterium sphagni]
MPELDNSQQTEDLPCDAVHQRFSVSFEYPVLFTRKLLQADNHTLRHAICRHEPHIRHRFVVIIDQGVARHHPDLATDFERYADHHRDRLQLAAPPRVLPGGELVKNHPAMLEALQQWLHDEHIDRHSYVVIVGGGALLDMAGFAAATAHRGIRTIRVPTTVLAQNDSGVGVKTAVNAFGSKNFLGSFTPPHAVINDYDFILTLPVRARISGMAEAVKVAAIRDIDFFRWLQEHAMALRQGEDEACQWMIRRCAELHLRHIAGAGDPFEFGSARPLDFGHWAAHKLESMSKYQLSHGEAVAIGMALDTCYAVLCGLLPVQAANQLCLLLEKLGFTLWTPLLELRDGQGQYQLLSGLDEFREHLGGELTITLLQDLGHGVEVHQIDKPLLASSISWLKHGIPEACA